MSSKKIKIHVWHTGTELVDTAIPFRNTSAIPLGIGRGRRHKMLLPVSSYFIEHPKGKVLIDTGWPESVRTSPYIDLGLTTIDSKPSLPFNWSVREHLDAINLTPNQIDYVLLAQLDTDHVGGIQLVRDAKKIMTSSEELKATQKPSMRYRQNLWKNTKIEPFEYDASDIGPLGKSYDLFNDGTVLIIATPGHSDGLSSVLITNADNPIYSISK
ncbi:MBL fold metallo-hydrolase [Leuconostoc lactis]|uniref:MBL fold metallo-hydrolase n=1 Tax=Leuconostoc lactis TaxID=1246 RepID=UPI0028A925BB|nr:MBL fold metallo-hydrolase [Leuconostoc lactis]